MGGYLENKAVNDVSTVAGTRSPPASEGLKGESEANIMEPCVRCLIMWRLKCIEGPLLIFDNAKGTERVCR